MEKILLGTVLRNLRIKNDLKIRELAADVSIDQALISKYESGKRLPSDEHISILEGYYPEYKDEIRKLYLAEKVITVLYGEPLAVDALEIAEPRLIYLKNTSLKEQLSIPNEVKSEVIALDHLKVEYNEIPKKEGVHLEKVKSHFSLRYTYESNKIEGNTLTLSETMLIIKEGVTIGGKSMDEHLEAINHSEAIDFMYDIVKQKIVFDESILLQLHNLILRGIDRQNSGVYRKVNVRIMGAAHIPPDFLQVADLMQEYFDFYNNAKDTMHPVLLAAEMHERLVTIHPFVDGNGRTARLVMNLILLQHHYPIAILKGNQDARIKYFNALEKVQIDGKPNPFILLIIDALKESLEEYILLTKGEY